MEPNIFDEMQNFMKNHHKQDIPLDSKLNNITQLSANNTKFNKKFDKHITSLFNVIPDFKYPKSFEKFNSKKDINELKNLAKIFELVQHYQDGDDMDYYAELPDDVKEYVQSIKLGFQAHNKSMSDEEVTKIFLSGIAGEYKKHIKKNSKSDDLDASRIQKEIANEVGNFISVLDKEKKEKLDIGIKHCEDTGNLVGTEKLRKMKDNLGKALNLDEFAEFCLHCDIKNFVLATPSRIYNVFKRKYEHSNNANTVINDIAMCPDILDKHLPQFTHKDHVKLCIAFCTYCRNMNPDNMDEHVFMYHFIRNIILLDQINPNCQLSDTMTEEAAEFYNTFTSNLAKCISNLLQRDITSK